MNNNRVIKSTTEEVRLWAKFFAPSNGPHSSISIPAGWSPFFTKALLSARHFEWAQTFINSHAWSCITSHEGSASVSFSIPKSCPGDITLKCMTENADDPIQDLPEEDCLLSEHPLPEAPQDIEKIDMHESPA